MKVRDVTAKLSSIGCVPVRVSGSHQIWKTAKGSTFSIVCNHQNAEVSRCVLTNVKRTLRSEGFEVPKGWQF